MQGMMDQMMGGMTLWTIIGVLLVVLLVVYCLESANAAPPPTAPAPSWLLPRPTAAADRMTAIIQ